MVINSGGGNKGKHVGRKFVNGGSGGTKAVRVAQDAGEMYATVSKMLGNCMCGVMCYDGKNRLCIIRKKFTGRRKTDNIVSAGGLILVGVHDYSGSSGSSAVSRPLQRCDLLYVYNDQEREKLRKVCDFGKLSAAPVPGAGAGAGPDDDANIKFITSGTGIYNKYANRDTRAASVASVASVDEAASEFTDTGTIGGVDWLKDMYPESDDDDDDDDDSDSEEKEGEEEDEEEEDEEEDEKKKKKQEEEEEEKERRQRQKKHVVHRGPRADTINVDDI